MYDFGNYLRICRENLGLTQADLVQELVAEDDLFKSLDSTTLSRWERGVFKPAINKQTAIVSFFSRQIGVIFPCLDEIGPVKLDSEFCTDGFSKFVGRHKMVGDFPAKYIDPRLFTVKNAYQSDQFANLLRKNFFVVEDLYDLNLDEAGHQAIVEQPGHLFSVCEYEGEYFGHFLALKLKNDACHRLMQLELKAEQLSTVHFASQEEVGSYFVFGFFGVGQLPASLLWVNFYNHLIQQQRLVDNIGVTTVTKQGEALAKNLNAEIVACGEHRGKTVKSYHATIDQFLLNDTIVRMLFNPESCPG